MTCKQFATLRARAALVGALLELSTDDRGGPVYVVTKGAATRHLTSPETLEDWLSAEWPVAMLEGTDAP